MLAVELLELLALVGRDLLFRRRNDGVGMLAEEHAAEALVRQKGGRGALDAQALDFAAALALEFLGGKRRVAREIGHQLEDALGKFGKPGKRNGAGIRAGVRAEIGAHAAQIFFDLAAGARSGAGANDGGGDFREARRAVSDDRVAAAEEKLRGNLRERAQLGENHLHAVRKSVNRALRPRDRAFRAERGNRRSIARSGMRKCSSL